jgi:hypothetical protein
VPRLVRALPACRYHRASKQTVVRLGSNDFYLGPYRSKASRVGKTKRRFRWAFLSGWLPRVAATFWRPSKDLSEAALRPASPPECGLSTMRPSKPRYRTFPRSPAI